MSKQKTQVTTLELAGAGPESASNISSIFKKYLFHWPLFLFCVIVFSIGAYFYLKVTSPIFPILSTLEFKAPTASSASLTVNQSNTQQELNPIDKPIIVENEIEVMQSKKLVYQVVNALQLWITYTQKKGFTTQDLYKRSPISFQFVHQNGPIRPSGEKMEIQIKDHASYTYKDDLGNLKKCSFGTPVKTEFGTWRIDATTDFENFIGSSIMVTIQDPDLVSDSYQGKIKVALENKDAPFVNLSTSDQVALRGKDILNSLMALYLQFAIEDKNKLSQRTLKFIEFRLDSLKGELDSIEKKIEIYRNNHNITDIKLQAQSYRDINQTNLKEINDIESQLGVVAGLENYMNSNRTNGKLPSASGLLAVDPGLAGLYEKLADLQLKREDLLATTPPANPIFNSIDQQIMSLKTDFKEKLQSIRSSLMSQKKQFNVFNSTIQSSLNKVPSQDREYASMERIQESKENIYKFLLEKHEQVALRYASSVSDSEVVDDAHAGKIKWPIVPVVYLIGVLIGLVAAAFILYIRESLNDLITSRKQIENETDIPILGELSYQDTEEQIVVTEGRSKFAIGEQFRVLRTNLFHLHGNNESGRVSLFTSSISGEGKSFVSSNLAVTLAYASRKTIILEMDLRKPKISVNFGLPADFPGISNYLSEEAIKLDTLIQPSSIPGLDVLGCGSILPNPSELLEKDKLDELIAELRTRYDEVIIDSPPIHLVTDALIIARVADVSVYVVRQDYTHKHEIEFISQINDADRFPKLTIVFNGVKAGGSGYGYSGYGYGYGYGGYGYGNSGYNSYASKEKITVEKILKGFISRF